MRLISASHSRLRGATRERRSIDEVHHSDRFHLRACARKLKKPVRCTLKRKTAEVSSTAALFRKKPKPSPFEEAARKDSAVHVSLSSDSPVKQPGTSRLLLPDLQAGACQEADEARTSDQFSETLSHHK